MTPTTLMQFQQSQGREPTGTVTDADAAALSLGSSAAPQGVSKPVGFADIALEGASALRELFWRLPDRLPLGVTQSAGLLDLLPGDRLEVADQLLQLQLLPFEVMRLVVQRLLK